MEILFEIFNGMSGNMKYIGMGAALAIMAINPIISYFNYQSLDDIEQVFLTKKQQVAYKLSTIFTVFFSLFIYLAISLALMRDEASRLFLAVFSVLAIFLLGIIYLCSLVYWIYRKIAKKEKIYYEWVDIIKYGCGLIIGTELVQLVYIEYKNIYWVLVVCAIVAMVVTIFMAISLNAMNDRKSRIYIQHKDSDASNYQSYFIYNKEDYFVCGNNPLRKEATELMLMSFEDLKMKMLSILPKDNTKKDEATSIEQSKDDKGAESGDKKPQKNVFKDLDKALKKARKSNGRFEMEVESESVIDDFYDTHIDLESNRLSNRLQKAKEYDEKFKTLVLPIFIAICFGIVLAGVQGVLGYQKSVTIDVMNQAWEVAQEKIESTPMAQQQQELTEEMYKDYQTTMNSLWIIFIILVVLLIALIFVCMSPFDIWYDHRSRRTYQWEYERARLEKLLEQRRTTEKELKRK